MWHRCKNENEIKCVFRKLAHYLHPDKGGSAELMILLTESYQIAREALIAFKDHPKKEVNLRKKETTYEYPLAEYPEVVEDIFDGDPMLEIINEILAYAETHPSFSPRFIIAVKDFLYENGFVSSTQFNKLRNIYYSFHVYKKNKTKK